MVKDEEGVGLGVCGDGERYEVFNLEADPVIRRKVGEAILTA